MICISWGFPLPIRQHSCQIAGSQQLGIRGWCEPSSSGDRALTFLRIANSVDQIDSAESMIAEKKSGFVVLCSIEWWMKWHQAKLRKKWLPGSWQDPWPPLSQVFCHFASQGGRSMWQCCGADLRYVGNWSWSSLKSLVGLTLFILYPF